jgi:hypothetical protein
MFGIYVLKVFETLIATIASIWGGSAGSAFVYKIKFATSENFRRQQINLCNERSAQETLKIVREDALDLEEDSKKHSQSSLMRRHLRMSRNILKDIGDPRDLSRFRKEEEQNESA